MLLRVPFLQEKTLLVFDASDFAVPPTPPSSATEDDEAMEWVITQTVFNGFAKYAGRYMQIMSMAPSVALETFSGLCDLFEYYVYVVRR